MVRLTWGCCLFFPLEQGSTGETQGGRTKRKKRQAGDGHSTTGSTLSRQENRHNYTDFLSGGLNHRRGLVPSRPLSLLRQVARVSPVDDGAFNPLYLARVLSRGRYPVRYISAQTCLWAAFLTAASGGCCAMRVCPEIRSHPNWLWVALVRLPGPASAFALRLCHTGVLLLYRRGWYSS